MLRWLVPIVIVYVVLLVALPVQMLLQTEVLTDSIVRTNPSLPQRWVDSAVFWAPIYAGALHGINALLAIWFTVKVLQGRQWARIAFSLYLVIALAGSLISAAVGGLYLFYVIPSDLIHGAILIGLWAPPSVRRFFAEHRAARKRSRSRIDLSVFH